jgi:cell envelope opacity-associated protein A
MEGGEWDSGWIYDPKEGKSYSVSIALADMDTLKVTGYLVMKMMGRTLTWKRAPDDLPPCAQNAAITVPPKTATKTPAAAKAAAQQSAKVPADGASVTPAAASAKAAPKTPAKTTDKPSAKASAKATAPADRQEQLPWAEK